MVVQTEKAFPRGGEKPVISKVRKGNFNLFSVKKSRKHKGKDSFKSKLKLIADQRTEQDAEEHRNELYEKLRSANYRPLSYKNLQEGMLVLGCIRDIKEHKLIVSLPGHLFGEVSISNLSEPYNTALQNVSKGQKADIEKILSLKDMYFQGQKVVTCVTKFEDMISLSMMPNIVQSYWSPRSMTVGCVITAAVKNHEEHGYVMDTGVQNVRAFMKNSTAEKYEKIYNRGKTLGIGQVINCVIVSSDVTASVATIELSADPDQVLQPMDATDRSLDTVLPGTVFNVKITQVLYHGLEVSYNEDLKGYVDEKHLTHVFDRPTKYEAGTKCKAALLYIFPLVKYAHFSMKASFLIPKKAVHPLSEAIEIGRVHKAKLVAVRDIGATLKLKNKFKGFVPKSKFPSGEQLKEGKTRLVKVLANDYMSEVFICTLEREFTKSQVQASDLKPGMKVKCQIQRYVDNGALVSLDIGGMAFVREAHMGNEPSRKAFPLLSKHRARVLKGQGDKLELTLKPSLIKSKIQLCSINQFKEGMHCEGVVMLIKEDGALVTFFGDAQGWLPNSEGTNSSSFHLGQLVKCVVSKVDIEKEKLTLSLTKKQETMVLGLSEKREKPLTGYQVGKRYTVTILETSEHGLVVESEDGVAKIPVQHLTDNPKFASSLWKTYNENETIRNVYCVYAEGMRPVLTLKPTLVKYFQNNKEPKELEEGKEKFVPCVVKEVTPDTVLCHVPFMKKLCYAIRIQDFCKNKIEGELVPGQTLTVCVSKIPGTWSVTSPSKKIPLKPHVDPLCGYWQDCERLAVYWNKKGSQLMKFSPGTVVMGIVQSFSENGIKLKLEYDIKGIVPQHLNTKETVKCGDKVMGTVVFIDYQTEVCELTINPSTMERISKIQDGSLAGGVEVGSSVVGEVLTTHSELAVVLLEGQEKLAYVPTRRHLNDIIPDRSLFEPGKTNNLKIQSMVNGKIVCLLQEYKIPLVNMTLNVSLKDPMTRLKESQGNQNRMKIQNSEETNMDGKDNAVSKKVKRKRRKNKKKIQKSEGTNMDGKGNVVSKKVKRKRRKNKKKIQNSEGTNMDGKGNVVSKKVKRKRRKSKKKIQGSKESNVDEKGNAVSRIGKRKPSFEENSNKKMKIVASSSGNFDTET